MSQTPIPEFAETELWVVRSTCTALYGHDIRKTKINVDEAPAKTADAAPDKPDLSPLFWGN